MHIKTITQLLILFSIIYLPKNIFAGAWTIGKSDIFTEMYYKYYWSDKNFDNNGKKEEIPFGGKYDEQRTEFKMEYGVLDNINLSFSIPYKWAKFENEFDTFKNKHIEDIFVGLKYRVLNEDDYQDKYYPTISILLREKFPSGYDENKSPSLGDGERETETRLLIGKKFNKSPDSPDNTDKLLHSIGAEIGYRIRAREFVDKIPYFAEMNLELPLKVPNKVFLRAILDGVKVTSSSTKDPTEKEVIKKKYEEYSK
ncbi:MAG: hypothetical protein AB1422_10110 [bacterium]